MYSGAVRLICKSLGVKGLNGSCMSDTPPVLSSRVRYIASPCSHSSICRGQPCKIQGNVHLFLQSACSMKRKKGKVIPLQARCGPEDGYRYSSTLP